jgi:hypothetical protein
LISLQDKTVGRRQKSISTFWPSRGRLLSYSAKSLSKYGETGKLAVLIAEAMAAAAVLRTTSSFEQELGQLSHSPKTQYSSKRQVFLPDAAAVRTEHRPHLLWAHVRTAHRGNGRRQRCRADRHRSERTKAGCRRRCWQVVCEPQVRREAKDQVDKSDRRTRARTPCEPALERASRSRGW